MRRKKAIIILNGISLKKKLFYHEYLPALSDIFDVEVHETLSKNDAKTLASKFTDRYVDVILAAGGDGTLNKMVNGVLKGRETETKLPTLGVIPIGSGNDFVKGAGLEANVDQMLTIFSAFEPKPVDVGHIEFSTDTTGCKERDSAYFINVADTGMGPQVVEKVLGSGRPFGSTVSYYKNIIQTFFTYKPMVVRATTDHWTWEGKLRSLALANGKYIANGLCIAPDAVMDDRMFSVFICGTVSIFDFLAHVGKLRRGQKVAMNKVLYKTATGIELVSERPCPIEGDGEMLGWLPAKITMIKKRLQFLI